MNAKKTIIWVVTFLLMISHVFAEEDYAEIFMIRNGNDWHVETASSGFVNFAYKPRPEEKGEALSREQAIETANGFLEMNSDCLGLGNFVYSYDELNEGEYFSYWIIDFSGVTTLGIMPPHAYLRIFMSRDGQVYALGDIDFYKLENVVLIQGDIIQEDEAVETAQEKIESVSAPTDVELLTSEDDNYPYLWRIEFDNKEVLVDAKTGEVLSIKSTKESSKLIDFSEPPSPIMLIMFFIIIMGINIILLFFIKRKRELREK